MDVATLGKKIRQRLKPIGRNYRRLRALPPIVRFLNQESQALYKKYPPALSLKARRAVEDLNEQGIALSHLDDLLTTSPLTTLQAYIRGYETKKQPGQKKPFLEYLWGERLAPLELESPFIQLALCPEILAIVNSYLGLYARFHFSSFNITKPMMGNEAALGSQRWHRDPSGGDTRICKIFLYLNDVDSETGPFEYIKTSHRTGSGASEFPLFNYDGFYPEEGAVERSPLFGQCVSCKRRAGTLIFCDTTGLHRGGYSTKKSRLMSTFSYTSHGSPGTERFIYPDDIIELTKNLPLESRYAIKRGLPTLKLPLEGSQE